MKLIKCVVVGDGMVGKRCLSYTYTNDAFPGECISSFDDYYCKNIMVEDQAINLQVWVIYTDEDNKKPRALSYPQTDVFIFCFSLVMPDSLKSIQNMWIPEVKEHAQPHLIS